MYRGRLSGRFSRPACSSFRTSEPVLAFFGPGLVALFAGGFEQFLYVLILYGIIIVIDGLVLQPVIMRRTARVPIWASLDRSDSAQLDIWLLGIAAGGPAAGGHLRVPGVLEKSGGSRLYRDKRLPVRQSPEGGSISPESADWTHAS